MDYKDYYKILGGDKSVSQNEINKAFRKLAVLCHPDKIWDSDNTREKLKEINEALGALGNTENSKKYVELGANWKHFDQHDSRNGDSLIKALAKYRWGPFYSQGDANTTNQYAQEDFSDFFNAIFRRRVDIIVQKVESDLSLKD